MIFKAAIRRKELSGVRDGGEEEVSVAVRGVTGGMLITELLCILTISIAIPWSL